MLTCLKHVTGATAAFSLRTYSFQSKVRLFDAASSQSAQISEYFDIHCDKDMPDVHVK